MNPTNLTTFLSKYQFLDFTKSTAAEQLKLSENPIETWAQIGVTLRHVCWNNTKACINVGLDAVTYLAVSALRSQGFCLPPLAAPNLPLPHDDIEFVDCAVKRGLWTWNKADRAEMEEGIACSISDKYNVFQVVGEFCIAYAYESMAKKSMYTPSFLTASEQLENDQSFKSVGKRFTALDNKDQRNILDAIYNQKEPKLLSPAAKQVHSDMRALASKLTQGNQGFLKAFAGFAKMMPEPEAVPAVIPVRPAPPAHLANPVQIASEQPKPVPVAQHLYPRVPTLAARSAPAFAPSAPPLPYRASPEFEMAQNVSFIRDSINKWPASIELKNYITKYSAAKSLVAKLAIMHAFEVNATNSVPDFFWSLQSSSGEQFRTAVLRFSDMSANDFEQLSNELVNGNPRLNPGLYSYYRTALEFSSALEKSAKFNDLFSALQVDLLAN